MNNKRVTRHQADENQELYSDAAAIRFDSGDLESRDHTRQEDKESSDINTILARFGVDGHMRRPFYGETDFDLDLQQAMAAIDAAKIMMNRIPDSLQDKYPTWQSLLNAIHSGQLRIDLSRAEAEAQAPKTVPPPSPQSAVGTPSS